MLLRAAHGICRQGSDVRCQRNSDTALFYSCHGLRGGFDFYAAVAAPDGER
jgi:hypothetical protein